MALKDILVHVDSGKASAGRIDAAIALAQGHGAHLTALYATPQFSMPPYAEVQLPLSIIEEQQRGAEAEEVKARGTFEAATSRADLRAEWRNETAPLAVCLNQQSRYFDLIILGQQGDEDSGLFQQAAPDEVVLTAGRPVLVIPFIGALRPIGARVVVAWNASREAARAINDALPILESAQQVEVLAINPPPGEIGEGDTPSADICLHLARHGVTATARTLYAHDLDVGNMLLSHAADESADLIVMGAYGHSRLREFVLGGATKHLLQSMTVPVLLSH